jgi:hypothetical protein
VPIKIGDDRLLSNVVVVDGAELDLGDGEALFALLCAEMRALSSIEQLEVLGALSAGGWSTLSPALQRRFDRVADSYLDGGGL